MCPRKECENLRIPPNSRSHCSKMPKTMRINHASPRREIKYLQTHRHDNPRDNQTRPCRPKPPTLPVPLNRVPRPKQILCDTNNNIGSHIVRIIPAPKTEICDVKDIQSNTQSSPQPQQTRRPLIRRITRIIQPKNPHRRIIHPVHDTRARSKIVQLLSQRIIPRMKNHTEHPTRQAEIGEDDVVFSEWVGLWY